MGGHRSAGGLGSGRHCGSRGLLWAAGFGITQVSKYKLEYLVLSTKCKLNINSCSEKYGIISLHGQSPLLPQDDDALASMMLRLTPVRYVELRLVCLHGFPAYF